MKKLIAIAIFCSSLLLFGMFSLSFLIDYSSLYKNYINNIALKTGTEQASTFRIGKSPIPYLIIDNLQLENGVSLHNIEVSFTLKSLIQLRPQIKLLKIGKVKVERNISAALTNNEILFGVVLKNRLNLMLNLQVDNVTIFDNDSDLVLELTNLRSTYDDTSIIFDTNISGTGKLSGSIDITKKEVDAFKINIECPDYNFQFSGLYQDARLLSGKGEYKITNLARVISSSFPEMQTVFNNLSSNELIDIAFDLVTDQQEMKLKNVSVSSKSIVGGGEYNISTNTFLLNFPKINLNTLLASSDNNDHRVNTSYTSTKPLLLINKLLKADISISALTFGEDEYNNVKFISKPDNDKLHIKDFSGQSANGEFKTSGIISQNAFRSIFNGSVYLQHKDLNSILKAIGYREAAVQKSSPVIFKSDIQATLINLNLQNVLLKTDNLNVDGDVSLKFIGSTNRVYSRINVSSVNLSSQEYPVISPMWNFIAGLADGMKNQDYLDKFIAIRTIPYIGSFSITLNDLLMDKTSFGKVNLFVNLSPERVQIDNLYIKNESDYIVASLDLMAASLNPTISIKISDGALHVNSLSPKSMWDLGNNLLTNFDLNKVSIKAQCFLSKVVQNDLVINDLKFSAENDNNLLKISDINATIASGNLEGSGSILLDPYTLNFVYAFNSIDLAQLSSLLPSGFMDTSGSASINGMITTNGDTLEKQLYNLYTKSSLLAKGVTINNFSIDDLISTVSNKDYDMQSFDDTLKEALLTGKTMVNTLSSDIELTKGILALNNMKLVTKYTSVSAGANINIYNFGINLSSLFSFYILDASPIQRRPTNGYGRNYIPIGLGLKVDGNLFLPQKIADTKELLQYLQLRATTKSKTPNY